ncbi:glycosyltransferase family 87 protein [Botryobacter ruber]|uniref:glycosyltransferase family 87 protein n=1 Tax=Botryobacter ruber TaxID=2171629 RepID=UPI000E0CBE6F|nr:glycosyltransferase family 87 protein [Botryobacter ruber]
MKKALLKFTANYKFLFFIYLVLAFFATAQSYFRSAELSPETGYTYTKYNNYIIFKQSFFHLIQNKDIYILYLPEHWDLYKYSPTFSLLFGVLAVQHDFVGLLFWNIINALFVFFALKYLPKLDDKAKMLMILTVVVELLGSMQNEQSNGITAGLIILAFCFLERQKYLWATLCVVFGLYLKIFGIVALALFIFYPKKWKLASYTALWSVVLLVLPLLVVDAGQLVFLYKSWWNMLTHDHDISYGFSVMGWLYTWFGLDLPKTGVVLAGAVLFCVPLIRFRLYQDFTFRILLLASILLWVIIFNHKAESPTFIVAMCGVAIWFFSQEKKKENMVLFFLAILITSFSPSDIFPRFVREQYFVPYVVKAVPCILIWFKLVYEMTFRKYAPLAEADKPAELATHRSR